MVEGFDYTPHLSSRLLTLTPLRPEDWDALFAVASDPLIWALHPASTRYQEGVFRRFFDDAFADQGGLVARDRASGEVIGFSRYSQTRVEPGEVEIGWTFLARAYWGQGHNREMKRLMLTHAFRFVHQVIFRIGEANLRSRRAVEKIGGRLLEREDMVEIDGRAHRHLFYAITADDFAASPLVADVTAAG